MKIMYGILFFASLAGFQVTTRGTPERGVTIATGPSGALDCVDFGRGVCDVVTAVVPLKANANTITGAWTFQQLRVSLYTVSSLPTCNSGLEGQMEGVTDATVATYNAAPQGGGSIHLPVYCNGTVWVMH
jgi:hypothetical protein